MDAITPPVPVSRTSAVARGRREPEEASSTVSAPPPAAPVKDLPALPAAVQRAQFDPPPPKVMTLEQMAALLSLTT